MLKGKTNQLIAGLVVAMAASAAQAGPYSAMYVFGDSLSDVGNVATITGGGVPLPAVYTDGTVTGRFTNGSNYIDTLSSMLGLTVSASLAGGTDYAYGGARVNSITSPLDMLGGKTFNQQITAFTSSHVGNADPNALYVLWIGSNDAADALSAAAAGNPGALPAMVSGTLSALGNAIGGLASNGARNFLIPNLPDISLLPIVTYRHSPTFSTAANGLSVNFNTALTHFLASPSFAGLSIAEADVYSLQHAITADPASYGLTQTQLACYSGDPGGAPKLAPGTPTLCTNPTDYMYLDYIHPSAVLHRAVGELAYDALRIPEPTTLSLLFASLGMMGLARRQKQRS